LSWFRSLITQCKVTMDLPFYHAVLCDIMDSFVYPFTSLPCLILLFFFVGLLRKCR
jgi:hypothetical protein